MERFYRFELAFDGEPQGVGFLQGLEDVGLTGEKADRLYAPFAELPAPLLESQASFWFTRTGLDRFRGAINQVITALAGFNWQLLAGMMEDDAAENAVYSDAYQAAFQPGYLETDYTKFAEVSCAEDALRLTDPS